MFVKHKTQALIFKKVDRTESGQLFSVYTKDFGRIEVMAKGIRKISSKLRASANIFYMLQAEFVSGKSYNTLVGAAPIDNFGNLHNDLSRLNIAYAVSEIMDGFLYASHKDEQMWPLIVQCFKILDREKFSGQDLPLFYYWFLWNFMSVLGYKPDLYYCGGCKKRLSPPKIIFNTKESYFLCQNCSNKDKDHIEIEPETIKILRVLLSNSWKTTMKLKLRKNHIYNLANLSDNYINLFEKKSVFE